jgi:YidC/Oxa1 family membrane protein insertase
MAPTQQKTMKSVSMFIVPFGVLATLWIPSGLQFYFLLTAALQWLQSAAFYNPTLRRLLGMPPLVLGGEDPSAPKPKPGTWRAPRTLETTASEVKTEASSDSVLANVRGGIETAREKLGAYSENSKRKAAVESAQELEAKRALQEQEEYLARREYKVTKRRVSK